MRILFLNNFFSNFSGVEPVMMGEAELLKKNGHEIFFFATDKKPYFDENYEYLDYFPEYIDYPNLPKKELVKYWFKLFYNKDAEQRARKLMEEIKPDVVHCHNVIFLLTPSVLKPAYDMGIPVVYTVHGPDLVCPSDKLLYKGKYYCENELCIGKSPIHCALNKCFNESRLKSIIATIDFYTRRIHKLYHKASMYIPPSKALADLVVKSGIERDRVTFIPNFIRESYLEKQPCYSNKGYFLYVGRLDREKGIHYLLEAISNLPDIRLRIAGRGSKEKELYMQAKRLGLSNVEFLGFKSGENLDREFRNCIATILPCNWFENCPVSLIEAISYGKPVIASNRGGIPEIIEHNKNGIIIEPGNVKQLQQAIEKLYNNNDLVVELGKYGRKKAEEQYNPDEHYKKLMEVYSYVTGNCLENEKIMAGCV